MTRIVAGPSNKHGRNAFALRVGLMSLLLTGCERPSEIAVYRVPKEPAPDVQPSASDMPGAGAAAVSVHWTAPAGWQEQPATGFRKGSFNVPGKGGRKADVSVVSFPSAAGGLLDNVNRWRDQLHLAPITDEALQQATSTVLAGGQTIQYVDLVSAQPMLDGGLKSRILGGILFLPAETWFFKMTGPDALVASQRDAFKSFLQSVRIEVPDDAATPAAPPSFAGTNPPATGPVEAAPAPALQYQLPPGWQEKPLTPMRVASFNVPGGEAGNADASIVVLSGAAGGELSNINRWRGQIGLEPLDEKALDGLTTHLQANGHDFLVVDLVGPQPALQNKAKAHILVAMLPGSDQSWFVKMIGPDKVVSAQRGAFIGLLKNLRIPQ